MFTWYFLHVARERVHWLATGHDEERLGRGVGCLLVSLDSIILVR